MSAKPEVVEEAYTILSQLGGRRFLVMTGADKLMAAGRTARNPNPWLRIDLRRNPARMNRLKITLMPTDTYKVEFYPTGSRSLPISRPLKWCTGRIYRPSLPRSRATTPTSSPFLMRASEAPNIIHPGWNQYRRQVIAAITDVEMLMQQLGRGLDSDGLTAGVAQRLGLSLDTQHDFDVLNALVRAVRPIGREALRATREDQSGQFSLLLL